MLSLLGVACGRSGGSHSTASASAASAGADPDALAAKAAKEFLNAYMVDGGRIQRTDQGGDTVGEGQAYGMLIAAAVRDEKLFDQIWSWTKQHMLQNDGLLAFHWVGGRVVNPTPAADADLDAARALLVASCRFSRRDLRQAAITIGHAVLARETARVGSLDILLPGPWAYKAGSLAFNPSYVDPTTLDALARVTGDARFRAVSEGSTRLVDELTRPLPPDWASVNAHTGKATPVSAGAATSGPGIFSYDAPRTLVRMAVGSDLEGRATSARAWGVFSRTPPADIVVEHQLTGAAIGTAHAPITLVAAAGAAKAAGDTGAMTSLLNEAQQLNSEHPTYYDGAWVALGRLMLTTNRLEPCTG